MVMAYWYVKLCISGFLITNENGFMLARYSVMAILASVRLT